MTEPSQPSFTRAAKPYPLPLFLRGHGEPWGHQQPRGFPGLQSSPEPKNRGTEISRPSLFSPHSPQSVSLPREKKHYDRLRVNTIPPPVPGAPRIRTPVEPQVLDSWGSSQGFVDHHEFRELRQPRQPLLPRPVRCLGHGQGVFRRHQHHRQNGFHTGFAFTDAGGAGTAASGRSLSGHCRLISHVMLEASRWAQ